MITLRSKLAVIIQLLAGLLVTLSSARSMTHLYPDSGSPSDTTKKADSTAVVNFRTIEDRWRGIVGPPYELNDEGHWYDPYNQNILKGDYPIIGQNTFLILTGTLDNFAEASKTPTPSGVSALEPNSDPFFGKGEKLLVNENLRLSVELYGGDVAYRPRDWELKVSSTFNLNYVRAKEHNGLNADVRQGQSRTDTHIGFQELFFEKHLFNLTDRYDFISAKAGIQRFASDFREFIFNDFNLGFRLFGNYASNRIQYNLIYLPMLEKETNSDLNTVFDDRGQSVGIANIYIQDFLTHGYTSEFSFHYNRDKPTTHYDDNGILVRPAILGNTLPHEIKAYYTGWAGEGHFGSLNISHALYQAFGTDDFNSLAGRAITINAQMAAIELSVDKDWMRFRISGFYASGDHDATDGTGNGFDAIVDQPFFAGGQVSYWNSQRIGLQGVALVQKSSLVPSLRSSKAEGQSNFVNPGLMLLNVGYDAKLTQKLKTVFNINYLRFVNTAPLELFLNQPSIHKQIGFDFGAGIFYRPFLNNNAVIVFALSGLSPMAGFTDIYESHQVLYAFSTSIVLTY